MKDKGLDKGLVKDFDTSKRGENKHWFGFRKMFWDYLTKLKVPFYDPCCATASEELMYPMRYNGDTDVTQYFDGTDWTTVGTPTFTSIALSGGEGVTGEGSSFAAFYPDAIQNNVTAGTGGAISVTNYLTTINTDAGGDAFTLADGTQAGQMKKILLVTDGGGDGVVTPATAFAGGATTATFNDANDYLILMWNGTAWRVIENIGVTVA